MAGGSETQTTVKKTDPWGTSQPYLKAAMGDAASLYKSGQMSAQPFQGDRVANMTAPTKGALTQMLTAAEDTSLIDGAGGALTRMMNPGDYSARLEGAKDNALSSAIPSAVSMFSGSGLTNSTQAMDHVGRAATEAVAPYEYDAFNRAEGRALQAAEMAPGMDEARYTPMQQMLRAGEIEQDQAQRELDAEIKAHYEAGNKDANDLAAYTNMLLGYGRMGGTSEGTTTAKSDPGFLSILAGGLDAFSLFDELEWL